MKKRLKKSRGITLVSLVVTIIILLILATISIQSLTHTGLFKRAQEAKNATENAELEQAEMLNEYENALNGYYVPETIPDGATVTPINDVTIWLKTGGLSKQYSYTKIEEVIADNNCTENLMNNENAMKYLARSTGFVDAICTNEKTMTYLGASEYINNTVLSNESWKKSIKGSQYWTLVYASKTVTIYGAASETITIEGYYDGSFTTEKDGSCSHVVPVDTITLRGSVSKQAFTKTITDSTSKVYVMPEHSLYWYGNENTEFTGGLTLASNYSTNYGTVEAKKNINNLYMSAYLSSGGNWKDIGFDTQNEIYLSQFSNIKTKCDLSNNNVGYMGNGSFIYIFSASSPKKIISQMTKNGDIYNCPLIDMPKQSKISIRATDANIHESGGNLTVYALWIE